MIAKTIYRRNQIKEITATMKKILALAIGLGVVLGTVSFAQDKMDPPMKKTKKTGKKTKAPAVQAQQ